MSVSVVNRIGLRAKLWNALTGRIGPKTYFTYTPQVSQVLDREPKWVSADEAVQCIKSGNNYVCVFSIDTETTR